MLNILISVAILFALGTLALHAAKIVKNIIVFLIILGIGALVWIHVLPRFFPPDTTNSQISEAVEVLVNEGVKTDVSAPEIDWENPTLPRLPEVSLKDSFFLRPEIEKYVMTSLETQIADLKEQMKGASSSFKWPELPKTTEEFEAMTFEQKEALKKQVFELFAHAPMTVVDEQPEEQAVPEEGFSGEFVRMEDVPQQASGKVSIQRLPDDKTVLRLEDFAVTNGPNLMVYLCISPIGDVNVGFVSLGELKAVSGNQNYPVNTRAPLSGFRSVVIYSDTLETAYGVAPFNP